MKAQALNPYLPHWEYIPDGEPHVFGDRLYIFGRHDRFGGDKFCMNDYVSWSAPVNDLSDWRYEGVIYSATQDPRGADGNHQLWAPDVVQGKDGKFYLYYCLEEGYQDAIGVAVGDSPAGRYEYLGLVRDANGGVLGQRPGDTRPFDPGVFIDDDGEIYLYSGNGPMAKIAAGKTPKGSFVMRLEDDMLTLKSEPKALLPTVRNSKGTGFEKHEFFEASSIRKIGGRYYLVYSSKNFHELCYAVSDHPDRNYKYGGVIVSNCDKFPGDKTRNKPRNAFGNNHGGIECVNGAYYIFYHRQTNRTLFSRQGCAEKIRILSDGSIPQVQLTSCGLNGKPLNGVGNYPASCACQVYGKHDQTFSFPQIMRNKYPYFTQDAPDFSPETGGAEPRQYIANGKDGLTAVFKSFTFDGKRRLTLRCRGTARGKITVSLTETGAPVCTIPVSPSEDWTAFSAETKTLAGVYPLYFRFHGKGTIDLLDFTLEEATQ